MASTRRTVSSDISESLDQEQDRLRNLQENLARSQQFKESMLCILDSFEKRLEHLESTVMPLYEQTGRLQRKQHNIGKVLKSIDATLGFYTTQNEMETIIRESNPADDLDNYLKQMERMKEAAKFFGKEQASSAGGTSQLENMALEKEYRELLARNSSPAKPMILLECLDDDFEVISSRLKTIETLRDVDRVRKIGQWLLENGSSDNLCRSYARVRGDNMQRTLQSLYEARKLSEKTGSLHTVGLIKAEAERKSSGLLSEAFRKASQATGVIRPGDKGYRRTVTQALDRADVCGETEAEGFLRALGCFIALLQIETDLLSKTIGNVKHEARIQRELAGKSLSLTIMQGQTLCDVARQALSRQEFTTVLAMLPVSKYLHAHVAQLDSLAKNSGGEVYSQFVSVFQTVDSLCYRGIQEFKDMVKTDQDKFVPRDGTVHQVTSNVLGFLKHLHEQRSALLNVLVAADGQSGKQAVPQLFSGLLAALQLNIANKSEVYQDQTLKFLFLLNNYNHIYKTLLDTGLLKVVMEQAVDVEKFYKERKITDYLQQYKLSSWSKALNCFAEFSSGDAHPVHPGALCDKDREAVKNAFSTFNKELETALMAQRDYSVPDVDLSERIKRESRDFVVPKYAVFYNRFYSSNFSRNPEKYLRYSPESVGIRLSRLFDPTDG